VSAGPTIAVIDYGIGNLRSAEKALQHVGANARLISDAATIESADAAVLPGVGAFGACMDAIDQSGLADSARRFVESGRPFLGICVGMQMLYHASDETPGRTGLRILEGTVGLLEGRVKRPQMQWNRLEPTSSGHGHPLLAGIEDAWVYFVHSYAAPMSDATIATCDYGGPVVAAVAQGNVWATQFHPEKSGRVGLKLLSNFVAAVDRRADS
jgi:glutamine amidotransferase